MRMQLPPRVPWPDDFPEVIVHGEEKARNAHQGYLAAKSGDIEQAFRLAVGLMTLPNILKIRQLCYQHSAWLMPVVADEALGYNAIPDGMASYLSFTLGMPRTGRTAVIQSNKVSHTRAPGFQRIVTPAQFDGSVERGTAYFLVDDHVGFGGTLANLIGYIESKGGSVVGCTTLTASPSSKNLAVSKLTLDMIYTKYGDEIDDFWIKNFGHGIDCLTQREAVLVGRQQSLVALKNILAQAAAEVSARDADT